MSILPRSIRRVERCRTFLAGATAVALLTAATQAEDLEFFEARVRPLLVEHCSRCHSSEAGDPEGGLSFDSRADFFAAEGVAEPGRPDESLLVRAVRYDGDLQMPPDGKLPAEAIATFEAWVRRGLPWPDDGRQAKVAAFDLAARRSAHWCWQPPVAAPPPEVRDAAWCRGDIDRFVLARLEAAGLTPAAEAPPGVLVRRASAVLTGLPPAVADVERVAASTDPLAFEAYVDELLASPHFGERFARHWLDVTRYGETRGHEFDYPIPNAWQYRDWVVRAFNADLPYDQFVREQVAGDLMEPRLDAQGRDESVVGTGFWLLGEEVHAPVDIRQDEADRIDNRVDTFGKAFLGLALGCARCHDHKFDAISAADYYAIAGTVMSSSYRQVPFETLAHNRGVAARLAAHDAAAGRALLPLVAAACGAEAPDLTAPAVEDAPAGVTVIADYGGAFVPGGTPLFTDGAAWQHVPAGQPFFLPAGSRDLAPAGSRDLAPAGSRGLRLERVGHARSDPVWATTRSLGDRDTKPLGAVDRAGRVLRTPKVRLAQGVLWHRVRGHVQIFTVVDSHVVLQGGPLHGGNVLTTNTKGEWKWVRQDLRKDIDWSGGHVVHVEYAAVDNAAAVPDGGAAAVPVGVAAVVATENEPVWPARDGPWQLDDRLAAAEFDWTTPDAARLVAEASRLQAERAAITADVRLESATAPALLDGNGVDAAIYLKGSAARPSGLVPRRFLEAIDGSGQPGFPAATSGRRELAERLLDERNPLTARVMVNRLWHHLFGRGLVPTTDNFGVLGESAADPAAQALLDMLAVRFRLEGWSVKRLVREIVTSSTWRMTSVADPQAVALDPLNLLLHHHPVRRLEAEAIRDTILAVSGRLEPSIGGPSVEVFLTEFDEGRGRPAPGPLDGGGRRSLYTRIRRNFLPGFLVAFDLPVPFQAMGRRNVTNVPAQALALMNDPFVTEQAAVWARRTLADPQMPPEARIERMYLEAFARRPEPDETAAALGFLAAQTARHGADFAADPRQQAAWADLAHALVNTKEFIFVP